jgi:hypothetical protein
MFVRTPGDDSHALAGVVAMIAPAEIAMTVTAADRNRLRTGSVLHVVDGEVVFPLPPPGGGCVWMKQIRQRLLPGQQADHPTKRIVVSSRRLADSPNEHWRSSSSLAVAWPVHIKGSLSETSSRSRRTTLPRTLSTAVRPCSQTGPVRGRSTRSWAATATPTGHGRPSRPTALSGLVNE